MCAASAGAESTNARYDLLNASFCSATRSESFQRTSIYEEERSMRNNGTATVGAKVRRVFIHVDRDSSDMDGSGHDGEDIHISHIASADDDSNSDDEDAVSQRPLSASFVARNKLSYLLENSAFFSDAYSNRSQSKKVATAVQEEAKGRDSSRW